MGSISKRTEKAAKNLATLIVNLVYSREVNRSRLYEIMRTDERLKRFCNSNGLDAISNYDAIMDLADTVELQIMGSKSDNMTVNKETVTKAYNDIISFIRGGMSVSESGCTWLQYIG